MPPSDARHLVLVGPTASGKSAVALAIARRRRGQVELVSADSMQVYRGMDIGTAKATPAERAEIPHHLLDLTDPSEEFSVAAFQRAANDALADIERRGARAIVVGGTGLYVRAVVDALDIPGQWGGVRAELEQEPDTVALHRRLTALDPVAAGRMEPTNRRRVVRALEVTIGSGRPFSSFGAGLDAYPPTPRFHQVGLRVPRDELAVRIEGRFSRMLADGLLDEVRRLSAAYGSRLSRTARQALGYRELLAHVEGDRPLAAAVDDALRRTRSFATRQQRWFRRDPRISWTDAGGAPPNIDAIAERVLGDWEARCGP